MSCGDDEEDKERVYRSLSTAFFFFFVKINKVCKEVRAGGYG